jgi:hypothetical protein
MFENCGSKTFAGSFIDFGHMHPYFYSLFWNNTFTTIVCKIIRLSSKQQQQNQKLLLCVKFDMPHYYKCYLKTVYFIMFCR